MKDTQMKKLLQAEQERQDRVINLIASENIVSQDVLDALASWPTNKYAEGYSQFRYYGGNTYVDEIETLAISRALDLFKLSSKKWSVNVQALSGSPANLAVFHALVPLGAKIMGLELSSGGHLTHGYKVSVTGKLWTQVPYTVDEKKGVLDYNKILEIALAEKPHIIIAGFSAYPRKINFKKFREIADACGAILMVDMAHISGLVAGKAHPSPFPYADVVTTTTHKTLRGPRGALIFTRKDERGFDTLVDKAVFPGLQGGPHMNTIASIAVALREASQAKFQTYTKQVVANAKTLASELKKLGWIITSGGTDNHLFLVDVFGTIGIGGKEASEKLEAVGIIVNKNTIPFDARGPVNPSGIRIGTPTVTTQGMKEKEMVSLAKKIDSILRS
jgi:glycine hydroxymethyltransferase